MKLGAIDLNLLVVFDAVMRERSVTRAGQRLGLSQPAMSHALAKLRHMLKDDLFVRSPGGMVPTPRSDQLALPVRAALDGLQHSLEPTQFDPHTSTRSFRIAVDNFAAVVLVGPLVAHISKIAPNVMLKFQPSGTLNVPDLLDQDVLDLAIGPFAESGERFSRQPLLQDEFVAVLRKNHPAASAPELSLEKFAALPHLQISSIRYPTDFVDKCQKALARRKLARRIALRAPLLSAVRILDSSDMVATFPHRMAKELVRYQPLVIRRLSHPPQILETAMIWPRRLAKQPGHVWLREMVGKVCNSLNSESSTGARVQIDLESIC